MLLLLSSGVGVAQRGAERELQDGFSSLTLGMSIDAAKSALLNDAHFRFSGDPEVSFLPHTEIPIIETPGSSFVDVGIFQFDDDALYVITLILSRERLDYFTVYDSLVEQYGEPDSLTPSSAVWESDTIRIALEKPLTIKYIDRVVFDQMVREGEMDEALETITRERFLEQL